MVLRIKKIPEGSDKSSFCAGCGHGIVSRLLNEVIEEEGYNYKVLLNCGVGCSCNLNGHQEGEAKALIAGDIFQCAHGRASASATAMKRVHPDKLVVAYQGDGDGAVIGLAETLNAAYRNENITVIFINNTNFGMTGGQMSWTTLPGEKTATSEHGRNCDLNGKPIHLPEIISREFTDVAYVARGAVHNVKAINETKKMIKNAIEAQINGEGYSMVEVLSMCPTNWHMTPVQATARVENEVMKEYPVGVFKERKTE